MTTGKTIMIDLDGVICSEERVFDRPLAKPLDGAREALQKIKDAGNTIVVYTARGWAEYNVTKRWLDDNGMVYDAIHMGKPIGHIWIDDRAIGHKDWNMTLGELDAMK